VEIERKTSQALPRKRNWEGSGSGTRARRKVLANEVSMEVIWYMDKGQESMHHFLVAFLRKPTYSAFLRAQLIREMLLLCSPFSKFLKV